MVYIVHFLDKSSVSCFYNNIIGILTFKQTWLNRMLYQKCTYLYFVGSATRLSAVTLPFLQIFSGLKVKVKDFYKNKLIKMTMLCFSI